MSDQRPSSPAPEAEPSGAATPERALRTPQLRIPPTPPLPDPDSMAPAEAASPDSPSAAKPSSPIIPTSPPPSLEQLPYKHPRSADLAYLGSLPTPTVRQLVDPRHVYVPGEPTDPAATTAVQPTGSELANETVSSHPPQGSSFPAQMPSPTSKPEVGPSLPDIGSVPPPSQSGQTPSLFPPNAILSSGAREWEGMTSAGVQVHRRDTWIVGQGWGRHLRVIDGMGRRRPASTGAEENPEERGVARHGTW